MGRIILTDDKTNIGAYELPMRKKPCICIERENEITMYGTFMNKELAEKFMDELAEFVGAEKGGGSDD